MNHPFRMTESSIRRYLKMHAAGWATYTITDGVVNADSDVDIIQQSKEQQLQVKFGHVDGTFLAKSKSLISLVGLPTRCMKLYLHESGIKSLVGIAEHVKECSTISMSGITHGGLGLLLIENLTALIVIEDWNTPDWVTAQKLSPLDIIKKYLISKDVFACQQELINAGYPEHAVL